jgi:hypothetical protein
MRTKNPDVFGRVQRAPFVDGFQAVSNDDSGILWAYRLVRTKHHLEDADGHKQSPIDFGYLRIPASTDTGFIVTIVYPSRICGDNYDNTDRYFYLELARQLRPNSCRIS